MSDTVERKIMFYRIHGLPHADGTIPSIAVPQLIAELKKTTFDKAHTDTKSRYFPIDDRLICAWPSTAAQRQTIELGIVRRQDLPSVDKGGTVSPLPIADDEGLLEITHIQFFPNDIVGTEFNFYGPRATLLTDYSEARATGIPKFRLRPLIRLDVKKQLDQLQEVSVLDFRVHKDAAEILSVMGESLPAAFRELGTELKGESFEVIIRPKRGQYLADKLRSTLKSLLSLSRGNSVDELFQKLHVTGKSSITGRVDTIDLLQPQFIQRTHIAKMHGKTRAVSATKMYEAIESAYNAMRTDLEQAASMDVE